MTQFTVHVGELVHSTTRRSFLREIWTDTFDSNCMVCSKDFDPPHEPPIRTISIQGLVEGDVNPDPSKISFHIHNRHLQCIVEHGIRYFPVSHAWHEPVALANLTKLSNDEAENLVYDTPVKLLFAAMDKYGFGVELWHDYISVPQWQTKIQKRLLLQLPAIFSHAHVSLIHLDDFPVASIQRIFATASENTYALSHEERLREIARFNRAWWHDRMWVSLELAHSKKTCIVTEDYVVIREDRFMSDSFFFFLEYLRDAMRHIGQQLGVMQFEELFFQLGLRPLNYTRKEQNPCFGEVFSLIAEKECRDFGDRQLAIASFLGLATHNKVCAQFQDQTADEVCEWVWKSALEQGDCSPLLLVQAPTSRLKHPHPGWIAGGREMAPWMWNLGSLVHRPSSRVCQGAGDKLRLSLDYVGSFNSEDLRFFLPKKSRFASVQVPEDWVYDDFLHVMRQIMLSCPRSRTAAGFVTAMGRVYPVYVRLVSDDGSQSIPTTLPDYVELEPDFVHQLQLLLDEITALVPGDEENSADDMDRVAQDIINIMRLLVPCITAVGRFSRLTYAAIEGTKVYQQTLAIVRCPGCSDAYPFRVQLLGRPMNSAHIYRIPGLQYSETLRDGVGIVVSGGRIIGRVISATPACECKTPETLEL